MFVEVGLSDGWMVNVCVSVQVFEEALYMAFLTGQGLFGGQLVSVARLEGHGSF